MPNFNLYIDIFIYVGHSNIDRNSYAAVVSKKNPFH